MGPDKEMQFPLPQKVTANLHNLTSNDIEALKAHF